MSNGTERDASTAPAFPVRYTFDGFRIEIAPRQLFRENVRIPLADKPFETLVALVRRKGQLVTKDELISEVWPDTFVSEDSLTQNISGLRRILEDDPSQPRFIATVARRGYRFIAPVTIEFESAATPDRASMPPAASTSDTAATPVATPPLSIESVRERPQWISAARWAAVGVLLGLAAGVGVMLPVATRSPEEGTERLRFTLDVPAGSTLASGGTVSPDGRHVAFIARDDRTGQTKLWIQTLSTATVRTVPGSEGALRPFWAPDSQAIAFFGANRLRRVAVDGGLPTIVCETRAPRPSGGSWNRRDEILFADIASLYRVSARGGAPREVLSPAARRKELSLAWPQFLPGGEQFIYEATSADPSLSGIYGTSLGGDDPTKLLAVEGQQVAYTGDSLVYIEAGQLKARAYDPAARRFTGDPVVVADAAPEDALVSASVNGIIAFGGAVSERLTWFDREGQSLGTLNAPEALRNLSLSPDQRILLGNSAEAHRRIWLVDVTRDIPTRFADGTYPIWSPDGQSIAFSAARNPGGAFGMYVRAIDRPREDLLLLVPMPPIINDFTRDGRYIVYVVSGTTTAQDVWLLPLNEPRTPTLLLGSPAKEIHAQVSPDGRWIVYASDEEGGAFQVYVQAFPELGGKQRVSASGGTQPQWRSDGKELFYLSADQTLMSVTVGPGSQLRLGPPRPLFRTQLLGPLSDFRNQYAVSADGQRFLVSLVPAAGSREPITIIVNRNAARPRTDR